MQAFTPDTCAGVQFTLPSDVSTMTEGYYTNGILASGFENAMNADTQMFSNVSTFLNSRIGSSYYKAYPTNSAGGDQVGGVQPTVAGANIQTYSADLMKNLQAEYCFHKVRYDAVLKKFLESMAAGGNANETEIQKYLAVSVHYNKRLNAMIQILDEIAKSIIPSINGRAGTNDNANKVLADWKTKYEADNALLLNDQAIIRTRKEMLRFTQEKNNHVVNQISLWAALNVLAIGAIFHIYRSM